MCCGVLYKLESQRATKSTKSVCKKYSYCLNGCLFDDAFVLTNHILKFIRLSSLLKLKLFQNVTHFLAISGHHKCFRSKTYCVAARVDGCIGW